MKPQQLYAPAKYASLFVLITSSIALLGWWVDHEALSVVLPNIAGMTFNTALCLFALSAIFFQHVTGKQQAWHHLIVSMVGVFAGLTLLQDVFALNMGIDQLFINSLEAYAAIEHPGRMSPLTALGCIFASSAYLLASCFKPSVETTLLADFWLSLVAAVSIAGIAMHFFLSDHAAAYSHFSSISLFTASCLMALCVSLLYLLMKSHHQCGIRGFFYFGTHLMYRLSYPKKFMLISMIFALPITVLVLDKTEQIQQEINQAELKIKGMKQVSLLRELIREVPQHRGMEFATLHGSQHYKEALESKAVKINALLQQHIVLSKGQASWVNIGASSDEMMQDWRVIRRGKLKAEQSWALHSDIIALLNAQIFEVGHSSLLIYESDVALNHLLDLQIHDLPAIFELSGKLRGLGAGLLAGDSITEFDKVKLAGIISQVSMKINDTRRDINLAGLDNEPQAALMLKALADYQSSSLSLLRMIYAQFYQQKQPTITVKAYFEQATHTLDKGFAYFAYAETYIKDSMQQRIALQHRAQYNLKFGMIILVLIMFYVFVTFYRSIISMVEALETSALRMTSGDMQVAQDIPEFDELGKVVHSFNTVADALRRSTSHIEAVVEHSIEGIITTDDEANIVSFNPAAVKIFGYAAAEVIGENITLLMPETLKKQHIEKFSQYKGVGASSFLSMTMDLRGLRKDASEFVMEISVNSMDLEGKVMYLAMFRDITERHALELQLRQAQKMEAVGVLTGGIAHNFNNMMMALTGRLYIVKKNIGKPDKVREQLDLASVTIDEAKTMVQQLLAFSRQDFFVIKEDVAFNDLVVQSVATSRLALKSDVDMQLHTTEDIMQVHCNASAIQQIMMNLINNAHDAISGQTNKNIDIYLEYFSCEEDASQTTVALHAGEYACLTVRDNGCGIKKENLSQIFEPYFTTKSVGEGTGLGLATIFGTVESHGGKVDVLSEVGVGSSFIVYLPLVKPS